jgi:hypothetical protein
VLDVKHIAMARRVAQGGLLPGALARGCLGNLVFGIRPLSGRVEQMDAACIAIAMRLSGEQIAVGRLRIDGSKHRLPGVIDLIVQAHADGGQVLCSQLMAAARCAAI